MPELAAVPSAGRGSLADSAQVFRAAGHPARLRILAMLRGGPLCACQLTSVLGLAASTVSAHLLDLKRAGLVRERKDGRWVQYSLVQEPPASALLEHVRAWTEGVPEVEADARTLARLRRIPLTELCRAALDLSRLDLGAVDCLSGGSR